MGLDRSATDFPDDHSIGLLHHMKELLVERIRELRALRRAPLRLTGPVSRPNCIR